ncbi:hypothetical protein [Spirosoma sp. 209]|uniref:hypothetical protein n=1 Tax=Spirosoma sp. 209 TaxID=1955701 RepID=UPI001115EC26|nr:hypothetical protein [Spirosoma sp. 209]
MPLDTQHTINEADQQAYTYTHTQDELSVSIVTDVTPDKQVFYVNAGHDSIKLTVEVRNKNLVLSIHHNDQLSFSGSAEQLATLHQAGYALTAIGHFWRSAELPGNPLPPR